MVVRKIISVLLAFLIFLPPTQGWSQQTLEDQAQYYLQNIGPGQAPARPATPLLALLLKPQLAPT